MQTKELLTGIPQQVNRRLVDTQDPSCISVGCQNAISGAIRQARKSLLIGFLQLLVDDFTEICLDIPRDFFQRFWCSGTPGKGTAVTVRFPSERTVP